MAPCVGSWLPLLVLGMPRALASPTTFFATKARKHEDIEKYNLTALFLVAVVGVALGPVRWLHQQHCSKGDTEKYNLHSLVFGAVVGVALGPVRWLHQQ